MFVTIQGDVIHACLGYNNVTIQNQLLDNAPIIKEMSRL
jgi:hypothetical protein